eukprot:COSAG01_NODE_8821_length_2649_cov_2.396863_2_plen_56_part_00
MRAAEQGGAGAERRLTDWLWLVWFLDFAILVLRLAGAGDIRATQGLLGQACWGRR